MSAVTHPRFAPRRSTRSTPWWSKAWARAVEEAAYHHNDLRDGRAIARSGRVGALTVDRGSLFAAVQQGDDAWTVEVAVPVLTGAGVATFVELVAAESGRVARLLAGDLPHQLVEDAEDAGVELLPYGGELAAECSCQAWAQPCSHGLAVLTQFTWLIDDDPLALLHLRGLPREELLAALHDLTTRPSQPDGRVGDREFGGRVGEPEFGGRVGEPEFGGRVVRSTGQSGRETCATDDTPDTDAALDVRDIDPEVAADVDAGVDAALRAARVLELLDAGHDPAHLI